MKDYRTWWRRNDDFINKASWITQEQLPSEIKIWANAAGCMGKTWYLFSEESSLIYDMNERDCIFEQLWAIGQRLA